MHIVVHSLRGNVSHCWHDHDSSRADALTSALIASAQACTNRENLRASIFILEKLCEIYVQFLGKS